MNTNENLSELHDLQRRTDVLRAEMGINRPGEITFCAPRNRTNDTVLVEADGFGAAKTYVIEGVYPVDFVCKFERYFSTEAEAAEAASSIAFTGTSPGQVLESLL